MEKLEIKKNKYLKFMERVSPSEDFLLSAGAVFVGLASGVGVWLFQKLYHLLQTFFFTDVAGVFSPIGSWTVLFIPILGGLIVGLFLHFFIGEEKYHGVAGIMEVVALAGGRLRYLRMPLKAVAAAISIGSGASVGPEDPSVQIGAGIGSFFGQTWKLSNDRVRALVAAGAAGGIAAAFNAPIAGIFFAMEIILGEFTGNTLGVVVISAVISSVFTQVVSGTQPAFHVPSYSFNSPIELVFYLGLGLLAGALSALYILMLDKVKDGFGVLKIPRWSKPILAGAIVGVVGFFLPQLFGVGYGTIENILGNEQISIVLLVALIVFKLILTPVSIGGGFQGGVFAPALFLGATLGGLYATVLQQIFPNFGLIRPAFAMVGMAAVLAGTVRAPLTAIILLFEMTNDYRIILPLMFAVVVSVVVSKRLENESAYTLPLAKKGIRLRKGRDVEVLQNIRISEVMRSQFNSLSADATIEEAEALLWHERQHGAPVINLAGELFGIITLSDIQNAQLNENEKHKKVGEICTKNPQVAFPDETLGTALRRMGTKDIGFLPIVAEDNSIKIVGLLTRSDLVKAYELALTRAASARNQIREVQLRASVESDIIELVVQAGSACDGKAIKEIHWPNECIIASVRHGRHLLIPHGDTVMQAGDRLVAVAEHDVKEQLKKLCTQPVITTESET